MAKKKAKRKTEGNRAPIRYKARPQWVVWMAGFGFVVFADNEEDAMRYALSMAEEGGDITEEWEGVTATIVREPLKLFALRDDDSKPWEITR